ncbi:UPF0280 family protein [Pseudooceanicola algae]|uniref:Thiamine biosynthesis protein ApbE n=1 Tax=Pseudooceanicola algae TaxID=1537215 RepID=A0A418SJ98_9RHOB|nr:UPF0280 family protein [Pseudooceanicola algae]QPM90186.1 hypothetical protein PSAL_014210 [Pseudooceanicola algae]
MQAALLPDGQRLHLQAGPIDLVIRAEGPHRPACYRAAMTRFDGLLEELVAELPTLRRPDGVPKGPVAQGMAAAVAPFAPDFITPMAAVAGAVAEEILSVMAAIAPEAKLWVNNGGDIAWHSPTAEMRLAMAGGVVAVPADSPWRGCATSGRGGRSLSLGIADAVTVLARGAAEADAAATMIANQVDLPGHPAVQRQPAQDLAPDSDLGARLVTVGLGALTPAEIALALERGLRYGEILRDRGLIGAACLTLGGQSRTIGPLDLGSAILNSPTQTTPMLQIAEMENEHG